MSSQVIRQKFLEFFRSRGHTVVPSSSLVSGDPSVLLTTAGVQQFKPYYIGKLDPVKDFGSRSATSVQKCFRTTDIEAVGDETHLTFFEMLGNFSFAAPAVAQTDRRSEGRGGYFKKEAIEWGLEFLTEAVGIDRKRVSATYFGGDQTVPEDVESLAELKKHFPQEKIIVQDRGDNFWGPTGSEGPCGPTVEFYIDKVEIWNLVFNEYYCGPDKKLKKLELPGVDTGMGLERLAMILQNQHHVFGTDLLASLLAYLPAGVPERVRRIIADHGRSLAFLFADGVRPSNKETGYVLRRLLRRVFVYEQLYHLPPDFLEEILKEIVARYGASYPELQEGRAVIINESWAERERFAATVRRGIKELEKRDRIDGAVAFALYESYGLPYEIIKELGGQRASALTREAFDVEFRSHQKISRAGQEKKFGGHGLILDTGELRAGTEKELQKVLRLHTATHLLQQALREVLGLKVRQAGSDITAERARFDFTFNRKLTPEEVKKVEAVVNQKITEDLPVNFQEMSKTEAEKTGALHFFKEKYPERIKVYFIGPSLDRAYSKEFCGGPHVTHTGEIGVLKIIKEEAIGSGLRRIRAVLVP